MKNKEVWFYCKTNRVCSRTPKGTWSMFNGHIFPYVLYDSEYITVYKDGSTSKVHLYTGHRMFNISLQLDKSKKNLYAEGTNFLGLKTKIVFGITDFRSDLKQCYIPKHKTLLDEYKKIKQRISEEHGLQKKYFMH